MIKRYFSYTTNTFKTKITEEGRVCTKCGQFKLWENYAICNKTKTGKMSQCRSCRSQYQKGSRNTQIRRKEYANRKPFKDRLREENPTLVKGRDIRSKLMTRHRKAGLEREHIPTSEQFKLWLDKQKPFKCYYSGVSIDLFKCHVDHKQPLNRGGDSRIENLCLTDPKINSAKGAMNEKEFKELLELISKWEDGGAYLLMRLRQGFMGKGNFKK